MGRQVRRVPLDFDWPLNKIWDGFLTPDRFDEEKCPDCKNGYSPQARHLYDLWYGYLPFDPASTGSTSEGSPISPVFATAEKLAYWMSSPEYTWGATKTDADRPTYETALRFVQGPGWAPSFVASPKTGVVSGVEAVGRANDE